MNSLNDLLEMTTEMVTNIVKEAWENGFAEGKKEKVAEKKKDIFSGWIPCSFGLPEAHEDVIVSCRDDTGDTPFDYTSYGYTTTDGEVWIVDNEVNRFVTAWMPLPSPYTDKSKLEPELEPEPKPKPCPFCGKEPRIYGDKPQAYIACVNEECPVNSETIFFQTREEAIEAWNRRAE